MSLTARDRKIVLVLAPLMIALVYWFMILGPKRDEASELGGQLSEQEQKRDEAKANADRLTAAQESFRTQYASVVRLSKAIPGTVDMPGVIVQLDKAARGTGIHFSKIKAGARIPAAPPAAAATTTGSTDPSAPAAPGGQTAQSAPGRVAENAGNKVNDANKKEADRGLDPGDTKTSAPAREGPVPVGGGDASKTAQPAAPAPAGAPPAAGAPAAATPSAAGAGVPGLDTVPLELAFNGNYFGLADFLHRLKRFVRVANDRILVSGRLLTIDSFAFSNKEGKLTTDIKATVYLVPKSEGVTAGATPAGPGATSTPVSNPGSNGAATQPAPGVTR